MNWTPSRKQAGGVVPKHSRSMNKEAEICQRVYQTAVQLNGGSFVTVASSSAVSSLFSPLSAFLSSACCEIIAELVAMYV